MKKIVYSLVIASFIVTSCKKETAEEVATAETEVVATDSVSQPAVDATAMPQTVQPDATGANPNTIMRTAPANGMPQQNVNSKMVTQQTVAPVKVGKGMNPSHGQPGHRCDIEVGAPLNSAPKKATATTQPQNAPASFTSQQVTMPNAPSTVLSADGKTTTTTTTTPVATAPGMNPPHGQDGHVCSVAVGAPLPKT